MVFFLLLKTPARAWNWFKYEIENKYLDCFSPEFSKMLTPISCDGLYLSLESLKLKHLFEKSVFKEVFERVQQFEASEQIQEPSTESGARCRSCYEKIH